MTAAKFCLSGSSASMLLVVNVSVTSSPFYHLSFFRLTVQTTACTMSDIGFAGIVYVDSSLMLMPGFFLSQQACIADATILFTDSLIFFPRMTTAAPWQTVRV